MDDFIFNLADRIVDCVHCRECHKGLTIKPQALKNAINNSLGENARRMLEIGILQDELESFGFKPFQEDDNEAEIMYFRLPIGNDETIEVNFNSAVEVGIGMFWCSDLTSKSEFAYNSPTFREDVMGKIKELIND